MAKEISYQEALGESTGIRESESTRKSPKLISYDEAIGKKAPDAIDRGAKEQASFTGQAKAVAKDVAGYAAGVGGQLVDMFAAIPRAAAIPATLGVQLYAGAKGEGSKIAGEAGLLYQEQFLPEWTQNAYKKIAKALGPEAEAYYERNGIAQFLQAFGEGVEKGADKLEEATGYPAAFLKTAVNQGMDILGVKLTKGDLKRSVSTREAATQKRLMDVQRRPAGPAQFTPEEMTLRERADAARKAAAEAAASRSKWDEKQASEAAAVRKQEEWASRMEEPPVIDERFPPNQDALSQLNAEGKTRLPGEGKALDETSATIEAALDKVRNGQNFDLTAAEKVALRGLEQAEKGKPVPKIELPERFKNQKGEIDKKLLAGMAAAGMGAIAGQWLDDDDPLKGALIGGLSGAALVSMMRGDVPSRFYQSGAVKGKGGMWHPEAGEKLAESLKIDLGTLARRRDAGDTRLVSEMPENVWAKKAIKNYLNKHAGTATDPLKDIEVPFGEGVKKWEELTDKAIKAYPASDYHTQKAMFGDTDIPGLEKIPGNESIWNVDGLASTQNALKNYLSHVGDYLRENVAPEKLQQYDLVRAVQETAKWDEALAKKMAKERADLTKDMPLVKDYGDGFKWVEVKGPDRATTERLLKDEGDQMGHCVGGYCDYVESGDSKIYSLRDEKGKSHVTIEVGPGGGAYRGQRSPTTGELPADNIIQIKGKQNRAPNKEYLPYVQDFVKSGKWGEVGDLENARLVKTQAGNFVTMEEAVKGLRGERGSADPQVIRALAGAGLGALAGAYAASETDRGSAIGGAILGALGGAGLMTAGGRNILKKSLENADVALGMLSTRLMHESPAIYRRMQQMAMNGIKDTYVAINGAEPLFVGIDKLKEAGKPIEDALIRNDWNAARLEIAKNGTPGMMEALDRAKATIDFLGRRALEKGRIKKLNPDHFPRIVKDYEGLQAVLNPEAKSGLEGKLYEAERAMKNKEARLLTPAERTQVVEQYLRSNPRGSFLPDYAKARKITDVTDALLPFYEKPVKAFHQRMREMVEDYQRDELFGKDAVYKTEDGKRFLDLDKSIATLVDREMTAGRLTNEGAAQVRDMLQAYLKGGSQQMNWILQDAKNAITGLLLGNHIAALTQYADAVPIAAVQGFKPTLAAFVEMMQGKSVLKPADFGLINHISEEFISNRPSQRFVNWSLSNSYIPDIVGGKVFDKFLSFSGADMNMKQLSINAALKAGQRAAAEGSPDLARKWEAALGEDFPKLVEDLRAKVDSPLVREYVWHELTQQQPVSKLEMPQWALENPNGRILMSMKSWMLKQADLMRRKVYDQYKSGDKKGALGNALSLMTAYGVGGAAVGQVTNWLLGRDTEPGVGDIFENAFKTFALNQFTRENIAQGKVEDALVSTVMPPVRVFGDIWRGLWMIDDPKHANKLMRYFIPGWGPMAYAHLGGGAERFNERLAKEKAREAREALMTDEQREARDAKRKMTPAERRELRNEGRLKPMVLENYSNTIFTDTPGELRGVSNRQEFAGSRISEELKKKGRAERQAGEREFLKKRMDRVFLKAWKRNSEGTIDTARNLRAQAEEASRKAKRKLYI